MGIFGISKYVVFYLSNRKNIALCRMAVDYAGEGTEVEIGKLDGHQKRIAATVVRFPFYDPEKRRVRS